ncbi:MAG: IS66 family transposase [Bacteroidota bacterium]
MSKDQIIQEKDQQIAVLTDQNAHLKERIAWFERQIFGQKRERFLPGDPAQLTMDLEGAASPAEAAPEVERISYTRQKTKPKTKPSGRKPWPADLPRVVIDLYPEVDELDNYHLIGYEITEELEYQPEELYVKQYRRPKLMRKEQAMAQDEVPQPKFLVAEAPARPLPKLSVGTRLLAQIICDKFLDHLPLYRQIKRLARLGVKLPKGTVSGWIAAVCQLLAPIFEAHRKLVLQSPYLQVDETTIGVLDPIRVLPKDGNKRKKPPPTAKAHRGYYWVYHDPLNRLVLFDYQPGRGSEYPKDTLEGFEGILQTDGYTVYEAFDAQPRITLLGCLAHVRRKFFEAQKGHKAKECHQALRFIRLLYLIEEQAREAMDQVESPQEGYTLRYQLRQRRAKSLIQAAKVWLEEQDQDPKTLPQSGFGKALNYARKRFKYLERYLDYGQVEIDNNRVENQIRPIALGRKNYLFAGSEKAAQNAGNLYGLLAAAKLHGLNPLEYLHQLLEAIATHPVNQIEDLLPHRWQAQTQNEPSHSPAKEKHPQPATTYTEPSIQPGK